MNVKKLKPIAQKTNHTLKLKAPKTEETVKKVKLKRPGFNTNKKQASILEASLATGSDLSRVNLQEADLAAPHRGAYSQLRDLILEGSPDKVEEDIQALLKASIHYEKGLKKVSLNPEKAKYHKLADLFKEGRVQVEEELHKFKQDPANPAVKESLIKATNNLPSNAGGLGPHSSCNLIASDRTHMHYTHNPKQPFTPRSNAARKVFSNVPVATTDAGKKGVSITGQTPPVKFPGTIATSDVNVGSTVFRGALFVNEAGQVFKPSGLDGWTLVN
ncbi:MAG: hypothetical protein PHW13_10595 [Methylococcales bacterium]|nr:hypothetical protein [Methylococcales bacterium]